MYFWLLLQIYPLHKTGFDKIYFTYLGLNRELFGNISANKTIQKYPNFC